MSSPIRYNPEMGEMLEAKLQKASMGEELRNASTSKTSLVVKTVECAEGLPESGDAMVQNEGQTRAVRINSTQACQDPPIRTKGVRRSDVVGKYDAKDHWRLGLSSYEWSVELMGPRVFPTTLYLREKE